MSSKRFVNFRQLAHFNGLKGSGTVSGFTGDPASLARWCFAIYHGTFLYILVNFGGCDFKMVARWAVDHAFNLRESRFSARHWTEIDLQTKFYLKNQKLVIRPLASCRVVFYDLYMFHLS